MLYRPTLAPYACHPEQSRGRRIEESSESDSSDGSEAHSRNGSEEDSQYGASSDDYSDEDIVEQ